MQLCKMNRVKIMNRKVYDSVLNGKADNNIDFSDFRNLIIDLGFTFKNQEGSHIVYYHYGINEIINIQKKGNKAKDYQVRQLRKIIKKHDI